MNTSNIEWLNQNSLRAYPFHEDMQRIPSDMAGNVLPSEYALPNSVLLDFGLSVYAQELPDVYLSQFVFTKTNATFTFSSDAGLIASVSVEISNHAPRSIYRFLGSGEFSDSIGFLIVGNLNPSTIGIPYGVYSYDKTQTLLEPRCIKPGLRGVRSLSIINGALNYQTERIQGDVRLAAGQNIRLDYNSLYNAIVISADSNSEYNEQCDCEGSENVVRTINGIALEDLEIEGDDCVGVSVSGSKIKITNTCSKPCCGCHELTFINTRIHELNTGVSKLTQLNENILSKFDLFKTNYMMSNVNRINRIDLSESLSDWPHTPNA